MMIMIPRSIQSAIVLDGVSSSCYHRLVDVVVVVVFESLVSSGQDGAQLRTYWSALTASSCNNGYERDICWESVSLVYCGCKC
jgi:hypothetical protein